MLVETTDPAQLRKQSSQGGIGLAMSGGGYRAMMFHTGALYRLNEAGLLGKIARISSVSGGSITSAYLGLCWSKLGFSAGRAARFDLLVDGMRAMADTTIDAGSIIAGTLLPGPASDRLVGAYDDVLFKGARLRQLPDDATGAGPRFVINATNMQSAAVWRFSRSYMGDYRIGAIKDPDVKLSLAVAASSAFPPFLSPLVLPISQPVEPAPGADLNRPPFTASAMLSDGGVYDNLGLEALKQFSTVLVSDAGQKIAAEENPHRDWPRHMLRVLDVIDNQVRSLRKRQLIESYERGDREGTYWGVRTNFADYGLTGDPLSCMSRDAAPLAEIPTRLEKMPREVQNRLMNWGYAICDAALRAHLGGELQDRLGLLIAPPDKFPFPGAY
ncbi:putative esterase of the alpha-beta hydrolase superfamily [Mesorhizobium plurifarium]|uniref:Putative esterase of the alpha-beta hydrolase superfamily n=1 Tax=Mesorhizobium plurifarium TaxID=69974 RepID=A0A090E0D8_MESPL|nr:putative esterase of the alpha-beta hydrolase superfamily [Mesorhizobium plurifarium]